MPSLKISNIESRISKQFQISSDQKPKRHDLEERTERFAKQVRSFVKGIKRSTENLEDIKQMIRSSGSIAANYIEANEALSQKDFLMRVKICRKEAKETGLWLRLIDAESSNQTKEREMLVAESVELMKIFGTIVRKSEFF